LQQFRSGRWQWVGGTRSTSSAGFLQRVISVGPGTLLRVWSPRDHRYSAILRIT
jgi:hypothetical protein